MSFCWAEAFFPTGTRHEAGPLARNSLGSKLLTRTPTQSLRRQHPGPVAFHDASGSTLTRAGRLAGGPASAEPHLLTQE